MVALYGTKAGLSKSFLQSLSSLHPKVLFRFWIVERLFAA